MSFHWEFKFHAMLQMSFRMDTFLVCNYLDISPHISSSSETNVVSISHQALSLFGWCVLPWLCLGVGNSHFTWYTVGGVVLLINEAVTVMHINHSLHLISVNVSCLRTELWHWHESKHLTSCEAALHHTKKLYNLVTKVLWCRGYL